MEFIRVTKDFNDLDPDEINIISGALNFKKRCASSIMKPISDVFMLPHDGKLNFDTIQQISHSGYTRIPVYQNNCNNIVGILNVKNLLLLDADNNLSIQSVIAANPYTNELIRVNENTSLKFLLDLFKLGKSHMALVHRLIDLNTYEPVGMITLEDIIEELIQTEINDETDVYCMYFNVN